MTEVKASGRDVSPAEGKSEATEEWHREEGPIFKILLGTINLMLVAKYRHATLLTFLGSNPKFFFPITLLYFSADFDVSEYSELSKLLGWESIPILPHLSAQPLAHWRLPFILHAPSRRLSSDLCMYFPPQRAFSHLRLQPSPFLRGITNAYCPPSK